MMIAIAPRQRITPMSQLAFYIATAHYISFFSGTMLQTSTKLPWSPCRSVSCPATHNCIQSPGIATVPHTGHKKVLVTGAAGFIGSHVVSSLIDRGDEVIILDEMNDSDELKSKQGKLKLLHEKARELARLTDRRGEDVLTFYDGGVNNHDLMIDIFERHTPKWICHLEEKAGGALIVEPPLHVRANVEGTANMLEYSRMFNATNVVIISSTNVCGDSHNEPFSPYAATKRSAELISYTYHKLFGLRVTNLRSFSVFGPRGRLDVLDKLISRVSRGEAIEFYGDGTSKCDYTYIDDIVAGVQRALDRPYPFQIFNLGRGSGTIFSKIISLVEKYVGKRGILNQTGAQLGGVHFADVDVSKARKLLGFSSSVSVEKGVELMVKWYNESLIGGFAM